MLHYIMTAAQIIILVIIGVLLWQIWKLLSHKGIPDDVPLNDEQVAALQRKLTFLMVFIAAEAVISIIQAVLRFVQGL